MKKLLIIFLIVLMISSALGLVYLFLNGNLPFLSTIPILKNITTSTPTPTTANSGLVINTISNMETPVKDVTVNETLLKSIVADKSPNFKTISIQFDNNTNSPYKVQITKSVNGKPVLLASIDFEFSNGEINVRFGISSDYVKEAKKQDLEEFISRGLLQAIVPFIMPNSSQSELNIYYENLNQTKDIFSKLVSVQE
jgi:hypothetical protein